MPNPSVEVGKLNYAAKALYGSIGPVRQVVLKSERPRYSLERTTTVASIGRSAFTTAGQLHFCKGLRCGSSYRCAHTDVVVPDLSQYRRDSTKNVNVRNEDTEVPRKLFSYLSLGVGTALTAYSAKVVALQLIGYKGAPFIEEAAAVVEVNLDLVPEGKNGTFLWRGKPVFVRHRTSAEIEREANVDLSVLRDPQHDHERVQKPEWLILLAPCTHLGCVPVPYAGDYGGYFCPCHGSHYDGSGRVRRGPAPRNLEVPHYIFKDDRTILIGKTD
uniref:Cytochrome b-c1 complex subunit Rieske, mitochondrial n=1 Tax=Trichuris muris TaxID=70415 RepID=A0A5S6R540_TRIMR